MITLYSIGCRNCNILEERLRKNKIDFTISDDIGKLVDMGFQNAPILQINDQFIEYGEAMKKLKAYEAGEGALE
jgi:phage anti-repressor protein